MHGILLSNEKDKEDPATIVVDTKEDLKKIEDLWARGADALKVSFSTLMGIPSRDGLKYLKGFKVKVKGSDEKINIGQPDVVEEGKEEFAWSNINERLKSGGRFSREEEGGESGGGSGGTGKKGGSSKKKARPSGSDESGGAAGTEGNSGNAGGGGAGASQEATERLDRSISELAKKMDRVADDMGTSKGTGAVIKAMREIYKSDERGLGNRLKEIVAMGPQANWSSVLKPEERSAFLSEKMITDLNKALNELVNKMK
jgi:hypothetical protein